MRTRLRRRLAGGRMPFLGDDAATAQAESYEARIPQPLYEVPVKGIIYTDLSVAEFALYFDSTGLGVNPGKYANWARCNGSNGTPTIVGPPEAIMRVA